MHNHRRHFSSACRILWLVGLLLPGCGPQSNTPSTRNANEAHVPPEALARIEQFRDLVQKCLSEGDADKALGTLQQQLDLERRHFGDESDAVAESLELKANVLLFIRDFKHAAKVREGMAATARNRFGKAHWRTTNARLDLQQVRLLARLSDAQLDMLSQADEWNAEADIFMQNAQTAEAIDAMRQTLTLRKRVLGEANREYLRTLNNLAFVYRLSGDLVNAAALCQQAVPISEQALGREHPEHGILLDNFAAIYESQGEFDQAERMYQAAVAVKQKSLGESSESVARSLNNLGGLYRQTGKLAQAEPILRQALKIFTEILGPDDPECATAMLNLAAVFQARGNAKQAEASCQRAIEIMKQARGVDHPDYASALGALASVYYDSGRFRDAERLLLQAFEIDRRALGDSHEGLSDYQNQLGTLYFAMGDFAKAEPLLARSVESVRRLFGDQHPRYAVELRNLAEFYNEMDRQDEALPLLRRAMDITRRVFGEEHVEYAMDLRVRGQIYQARDDYDHAEPLFRECLELLARTLGQTHVEYARGLGDLAAVYLATGRYDEAKSAYVRCSELMQAAVGETHPDYATSLINLAVVAEAMGDYDEAQTLLDEALQRIKAGVGESDPAHATAIYHLAFVYQSQGKYVEAESITVESLQRFEESFGRKHSNYARAANNLGALHRELGNYPEADRYFRQALEIQEELLGKRHTEYILTLNNLAGLYVLMGDFAGAKLLGGQALELVETLPAAAPTRMALLKSNLGLLHWMLGEPNEALTLIAGAQTLFGKHSRTNFDYARTLFNLAVAQESLGHTKQAQSNLLEARGLFARLHEDHPNLALCDSYLGRLYLSQGQLEKAKSYFEQAAASRLDSLGARHPMYAQSLYDQAQLRLVEGDAKLAIPLLREALDIARDNLELAAIVQSRRQQTKMLDLVRRYLDAYLTASVTVGEPATETYQYILAWKGAVFERQQRYRMVRGRPGLEQLFVDLQTSASQLAALRFAVPNSGQQDSWRRRMEQLVLEREKYEIELARQTTAARGTTARSVTSDELRGAIPENAVLVDFFEYLHDAGEGEHGPSSRESRFVAYITRNDRGLVRVDLGPSIPIAKAIQSWRGQTTRITREGQTAANQLGRLIWAPLRPYLKDKQRVLVSPDGALNHFPLGALPGDEPNTYLIEELAISIVPSPKLLPEIVGRQKATRREAPASVLLVGNADFDASVPSGTTSSPGHGDASIGRPFHLRPLPGTDKEIQQLAMLCRESVPAVGVEVLKGTQATEQSFRSRSAECRIIHLATHGFFLPQRVAPHNSSSSAQRGLLPLENDQAPSKRVELSMLDPGLMSGVALAGANRIHRPQLARRVVDDGVLTALEVADLDLERTELAVLSACETGLGEMTSGEGLLSIQRAFQVAGADAVVASLWKVDDNATQALMVEFYRNLLRPGVGKFEALRDAQLTMLRRYNPTTNKLGELTPKSGNKPDAVASLPPWYWAGFVLSGNWR